MDKNPLTFIDSLDGVYTVTETARVYTVGYSGNGLIFKLAFIRWNESTGINYSLVILPNNIFVIYEKSFNGVQITDLS